MTESQWLATTNSLQMLQYLARPTRERKMALFCAACCRRLGGLLVDPRSVQAISTLERFADGDDTTGELADAGRAAAEVVTELSQPLLRLHPQGAPVADVLGPEDTRAERWYWAASAVKDAISSALRREPEPVIVRGINLLLEGAFDPLSTPEATAVQCQNALSEGRPRRGLEADPGPYGVDASRLAESRYQTAVLRCVVGNPFRPAPADPAVLQWRAGSGRVVAALATASYDERRAPEGQLDNARLGVLADALEDVGCTDHEILQHLRAPGVHVRGCWALDLLLLKE
jgi:hypothetical protein